MGAPLPTPLQVGEGGIIGRFRGFALPESIATYQQALMELALFKS